MNNTLRKPFNPLLSIGNATDEYAARLMRNEVKEIIGSYHHTFDHLYECIQNAVDACEKAFVAYQHGAKSTDFLPLVSIIIDLQNNQLTVVDNGVGMPNDIVIKYFFTPHATLKPSSSTYDQEGIRQRGEKGVGATFLSYGANHIHLSTKSKETKELTSGLMENGLQWCKEQLPLLPMPEVKPQTPHSVIENQNHGSAVTIRFGEGTNIGELKDHGINWKQWEAIIRLYTAVGFVDFEGTDSFLNALRTSLTVINLNGKNEKRFVDKG